MTEFNRLNPAYDTVAVSFQTPADRHRTPRGQLSSASSYAELQYLFGAHDPTMLQPQPNRNRRKSTQSGDHIKHRRTRSGCYTCRSRRVKCDEAHPICERCKKGSRECVYPETSISSKAIKGGATKSTRSSGNQDPNSSSDDYEDEDVLEELEAVPDGDEGTEAILDDQSLSAHRAQDTKDHLPSRGQNTNARQTSETPSLVHDKGASPTPSTEGSVGFAAYQMAGPSRERKPTSPSETGFLRSDCSHLPADLQFYLTYFFENISHFHYSLKTDGSSNNFLTTLFIDAALRNEALLYAVVGFSAFQFTLHSTDGKIQDFLQYYNKSVSLLLNSLKKGGTHSTGTLLAILQLATIEEFLGDWINLMNHQKAAFEILTEIYSPQTVMQTELSRVILGWYMRFDVFAGLMGGFDMVLSREWFSYSQDFFKQQALRLIAMDMGTVFARIGKGEISPAQFASENGIISKRIKDWKTKMDPALQDIRYLITEYTGSRPPDPNSIVDPYVPGIIYSSPLFVMNVSTIDWYSVDLMHRYQTALIMQEQPSAELGEVALATCQLYETIEFYAHGPKGIVLALQASLGIACLFLPRDERHAMWARRKLAVIEANGYIYPFTFRTKMSDLFRDRSCMHWWLPKDEGYSPIIRSIRRFVEERTAPAKDISTEDLRDMKAIFSSLNLEDGSEGAPSSQNKGKGLTQEVTVASSQDALCGDEQAGSNYGLPKPNEYQ